MSSEVNFGEKTTPGLNFDVAKVELFIPPASDHKLRDQEIARNSQFYQLMHDESAGKSKIDEILGGVRSGYEFNLPKLLTEDKAPSIEQEDIFKFDPETIDEIEENKKKVVRFYDGGDEVRDGYYGERDRGNIGSNSGGSKELFGVKSSYIVRTTLLFSPNLGILEKRNRPKIYCTGFCYPQFKEDYCKNLSDDELKDLLKSAFKLQIYATLEARNQQIESQEITDKTQVPLILNKPHEFIRDMSSDEVDKIRTQTKLALQELFLEQEITRAVEGKIDRVFLFDKPNKDEGSDKKDDQNEADKAFFTCEESDFAGLKFHRMPNKDILDLAKKYNDQNGVRIAVPIMKHPTNKDGNGMHQGSRAMEESFAMCSCYVWPKYLDGRGRKLKPATPIDFKKFYSSKIAEEVALEKPKLTTKNDFLPGLIIGGAVGVGLCATALACGVVLTAPVVAIGVGVVGATALTGALLYPQAKPFVENIMQRQT